MLADIPQEAEEDPFAQTRQKQIHERESEYQKRRTQRPLSPERNDPFAVKDKNKNKNSGGGGGREYAEVIQERELDREKEELLRKKAKEEEEELEERKRRKSERSTSPDGKRKFRDRSSEERFAVPEKRSPEHRRTSPQRDTEKLAPHKVEKSEWDEDIKPSANQSQTQAQTVKKRSRWDETPTNVEAETPRRSKSRWDETPVGVNPGDTPVGNMAGMMTPVAGQITPEMAAMLRSQGIVDIRNQYMSDEELDSLLPTTGYKILDPPPGYAPIRTPMRKAMATPTPMVASGFFIQEGDTGAGRGMNDGDQSGLPFMKPEDAQYFSKLLDGKEDHEVSLEEAKDRKILRLLLKIKNGAPPVRKSSLRQITDKAREFGPGPLFNQILPLLMSPTLEDQERHLLVKVIDRILYKLDELVRPFVHKILVVIEPLLIDEDFYARIEGREIISNLSKAAGLATMISVMRPGKVMYHL